MIIVPSGFYVPEVIDSHYNVPEFIALKNQGSPQIIIELKALQFAFEGFPKGDIEAAWIHASRCIQMLWPKSDNPDDVHIELYRDKVCKDGKTRRFINTYFFKVLKKLCKGKDVCFAGSSSSSKTFITSLFSLLMFYSSPSNTTVLLSTTSASGSERRIWGEVKNIHRSAKFEECGMTSPGEIIEHIKALTADKSAITDSRKNKNKSERDLRNGILVVAIAPDSSGERAINTIIGTKNQRVFWIIDELPSMMHGVDRPRRNLMSCPTFMFIGIGNAGDKKSPMGILCEPIDGWNSIDQSMDEWEARTLDVVFLNGERSPNDLSEKYLTINRISDYPFPYLTHRIYREKTAKVAGNGSIEEGKKTLDYYKFCIGWWYGDEARSTIMSEGMIVQSGSAQPPESFSYGMRAFASLDPAFTVSGDSNELSIFYVGRTILGNMQLVMPTDSISINPMATNKEDYINLVAKEVVKICIEHGVKSEDFCLDVGHDGGVMMSAIQKEWACNDVHPVSSLNKSTRKQDADIVTQYWFQTQEVFMSGSVRGFNLQSKYAEDLFARKYEPIGDGVRRAESKKLMKKRIHRSPDSGDSVVYGLNFIISKVDGLIMSDMERTSKGVDKRSLPESLADRFSHDEEGSMNIGDDWGDYTVELYS